MVRAQQADVSAEYVLGIGGFDLDRIADEVRGAPVPAAAVLRYWLVQWSKGMLRAGRGMGSTAWSLPAVQRLHLMALN